MSENVGQSIQVGNQETAARIQTVAEQRLVHASEGVRAYHKKMAKEVLSVPSVKGSTASVQRIDHAAVDQIRERAERGLLHAAQVVARYTKAEATDAPSMGGAPAIYLPKGSDHAVVNKMRVLTEQGLLHAAQGLR